MDLQVMVNQAYAGGPYHRLVDYNQPPDPPLSPEQTEWADTLLQTARLR